MQLDKYLNVAVNVSLQAGEFLIHNFGDLKKRYHARGTHYTTHEDKESNQIYLDYLGKYTPEVQISTEETEDTLTNDLMWVIDPIEGTSNFGSGIPYFATQLCLIKNKEPLLSVVNAPILNQLFTCIKDQGAYLNGKQITVNKLSNLKKSMPSITKGTKQEDLIWFGKMLPELLTHVRTIRGFGSTGLELAYVAAGKIDFHINKGSRYYDYLPSVLLVREAGGVVLNHLGKQWSLSDNALIAGNKRMATQALSIIR